MTRKFQIALTRDFFHDDGAPRYQDFGLASLEREPRAAWHPCPSASRELAPEQLAGASAVLVLAPRVTRASLAGADDLLAIARFGVGYDAVDVQACTDSDVVLLIATGAVNRPVAEATLAWMLALTHHVRTKDRLVREGRWHDRDGYMGTELRDRTLGIVGCGGIGRALLELLRTFGMRQPLVYDPVLTPLACAQLGVRSVPLDELLRESDFVSLHCPLNDSTRNLIGPRELGLMRPTAYLLNTARGGIVDEDALYTALQTRQIAGAALDCFNHEPLTAPPKFADLENVLLAPHSIAWTEELFRDIGRTAFGSLLELAHGRRPTGVVNAEVFERPSFQAKWQRLRLADE